MTGLRARLMRHRVFALLLAGTLLLRVAVAPLWHGQDFTVWTLATSATLRGDNIYAHHPSYPGGPFAYVPLFLYLELPLRWLGDLTGASYVLLGKLPVIAADAVIGTLLYRRAHRAGWATRRAALLAATYLLNPLVLYDGAIYGRFDALACALLFGSSEHARRRDHVDASSRLGLALAVAAKTFPVFTLPVWLVHDQRRGRRRTAAVIAVVVIALSLPYLGSAVPYLRDVVGYDSGKRPQGSSAWALLDSVVSKPAASVISSLGLVVFAAGAMWIARRTVRSELALGIAATLLLFVACSKVVLEQYLIWPIPWLVVLVVAAQPLIRRACLAMVALLSIVGLLNCESFHPLGRDVPAFGLILTAAVGCFLLITLRSPARRSRQDAAVAEAIPSGKRLDTPAVPS